MGLPAHQCSQWDKHDLRDVFSLLSWMVTAFADGTLTRYTIDNYDSDYIDGYLNEFI